MSKITAQSPLLEIAVIVSEALEKNGIHAVLGGGGAVTQYSDNEYMSTDLDFITLERNKVIAPVVAQLGFEARGKDFYHRESQFFLEFPPGPLSFGDRYIEPSETITLSTTFGSLRIITPTQCVMDRLAWFVHGNDPQARVQAMMVAKRQTINWHEIEIWADAEGIERELIDRLREDASLM